MNITKEQLEEYIRIQKKERGVQLTEKEAMDEARSLLAFVRAIYQLSPELSKSQKEAPGEYINKNIKHQIWSQ